MLRKHQGTTTMDKWKRTRGWQPVALCYLRGIMLAKDTKTTMKLQKMLPSSGLTYPLLKVLLKMIFLLSRWDMWLFPGGYVVTKDVAKSQRMELGNQFWIVVSLEFGPTSCSGFDLRKEVFDLCVFFYKICILPTKVQEDLELKTMWNKPWWLVNLPMVFKPFKPLTRTNFFGCLCVTLQGGGGRLTSHENNGLGWCTQLFLSLRCGLNKWFCTVTATGRWEDNTTCVPQNPVFTECQYVLLNLRWYMTIRSFKGHMFSIAAHLNWLRSLEDQRCSTGNS